MQIQSEFPNAETHKKDLRRKLIIIIAVAAVGLANVITLRYIKNYISIHSFQLIGLVFNFLGVYLFYQIFDYLQNTYKYKPKSKLFKFFIEFLKIIMAFLFSSLVYFYSITRPIFNAQMGPNFLYAILMFSIPSAIVAIIVSQLRQTTELALQSRVAQAEAQYSLLEMQMQPHFLFNSLNVLSELIFVDPDLACNMTQKLADLYREILFNSKQKFSNLESEISILKKYIDIQKIRFEDRINFKIEVEDKDLMIFVPSLILQTLVENAIKHGISPSQTGGEIVLTVKPHKKLYEICISNTGKTYKQADLPSTKGTGLQNTRNRLALIYGDKHNFTISSDDTKTYVRFFINPDV